MNVEPKARDHRYEASLVWSGSNEGATRAYDSYSRTHEVVFGEKTLLSLSADPTFRGDGAKHNPEELLVASLASCHMLSYLALCARERIAVTAYADTATGIMSERAGAGHFSSVVLHPHVTVDDDRVDRALALHELAHEQCFIANSVNFPVTCEATIVRAK